MLYQLLRHRYQLNVPNTPLTSVIDTFRREVIRGVERTGLRVWRDFRVASEPMDLIIASPRQCLAVDLVGYPGHLAGAYSLERYRMVHRTGLSVLPLSYRDWCDDPENTLQRLSEMLEVADRDHEPLSNLKSQG